MPDISLLQGESWPNSVRSLLKDLGDDAGSHGLVIVAVQGGIIDGALTLVSMDSIGNAQTVIDEVHRQVHLGNTFQSSYKSPDASPVADNADVTILIRVAANELHLTFNVAAGNDAEVEIFENVVTSALGTPLTFFNMNRGASGVSLPTTTIYVNPTTTSDGTRIHNALVPLGVEVGTGSGVTRAGTEWPLKRETNYAIRLTNRAGSAQPLSIIVQGYEIE